ncbi:MULTISPECIES: aromatic ring-hydroxylating dioxygenase subunit alpha [unclassified Lysobacter]|uniref:aromatic ring-hydroxylating oxygenase subunit alpha n=1 Tax=unclassified Lysobacter TaxID=2635362 RepID=UPI001BEB0DFF|nr:MULTISPECIES: aromatic ring-hydroxylating dioxygenase subunit alpha [unclassified Lysobacter]MBT2748728.1 aromatic ring-hydroxylating dioxygenase subunit alpha [Lysobacter sp. ISL-42]MBT2751663.1 aromatic ring-hydroxylating dioxygenase subunit alpha [Lysobacter sp. ISL-50]MBT2775857.1 aromatic ring-hydroxylating dioxygenase subunit alpha [Lysobacter sp. ISL-54]MBT2782179.1 aromatic ring-hydroxylating dioxygenase subunit alpha [Lysobacter sp. ISL-52]
MHAELLRYWYPIARSEDVRERPVAASLLETDLVLYRADHQIVVAVDRCPHRGMRLSLGQHRDGVLICPYHGLEFGQEGRCIHLPAHPRLAPSQQFKLATYPAVERYGLVWTCLGDSPAPFPELNSDWDDPAFRKVTPDPVPIAASAGRQVEGFIDVAHFAHVHTGTFADPANAAVPAYSVEVDEDGLRFDYCSTVSNYALGSGTTARDFVWRRSFEVRLPYLAHLTVHFPGGRLNILNGASPVASDRAVLFSPVCFDFEIGTDEAVKDFNARIFAEDRLMVENQQPRHLPLASGDASFAADLASVYYRRLLRQMGLSTA